MRVNVQELIKQMEQVQTSLETSSQTEALAEIVGVWVRAVEHMGERLEELEEAGVDHEEMQEMARAINSAVSSSKGM